MKKIKRWGYTVNFKRGSVVILIMGIIIILLGSIAFISISTNKEIIFKVNSGIIFTENTEYTDVNDTTVIIPKGFSISTVSSEQTVATGLVIIDDIGNEFVWIPVEDGILDKTKWNNDIDLTEYYEDLSLQLINSIKIYKGFYLARYEAGIDTETSYDDNIKEDGTIKPLSQAGVNVWNYIPWDADSNSSDELTIGAVMVAESMYPVGNTEYGVVSTLCYGSQWDEALEFISTVDSTYAIDSTGKGNYDESGSFDGTLAKTGASTDYMKNNIYDMAGNVWELTMETHEDYSCFSRGGYYNFNGSSGAAYMRYNDMIDLMGEFLGFRIALYIQ